MLTHTSSIAAVPGVDVLLIGCGDLTSEYAYSIPLLSPPEPANICAAWAYQETLTTLGSRKLSTESLPPQRESQ
jgi:hypothetical protein